MGLCLPVNLPQYGLLSYGVLWPNRNASDLNECESKYAHYEANEHGLAFLAPQASLTASSTSAELMGLRLVPHSQHAATVAVDNQTMVDKANKLLSGAIKSDKPPAKLMMQHDGDLWMMFFRAIVHRGPRSLRVVKTTGHALTKDRFLQQFPHLRQEAEGNHRADVLAKKARTHCLHPMVVTISNMMQDRHKQYVALVQAVHAIIARVHQCAEKIRNSPATQMQHTANSDILHKSPWDNYTYAKTCALKFKVNNVLDQRYLKDKLPVMQELYSLIRNHRFMSANSCPRI